MDATAPTPSEAGTAEEVRDFTVEVSDAELEDLRDRIKATRWPDGEVDPSQGVRLETIQALATRNAHKTGEVRAMLGAGWFAEQVRTSEGPFIVSLARECPCTRSSPISWCCRA